MRVSVVVPTYNGEAFLADAIASVRRQQRSGAAREVEIEIIVVDDGSSDATARIASGLGPDVRCVCQPHSGGPARGRNRGVDLATGEVIGFLDQDDLWPDNKLSLQLPRLIEDPALDVVIGRVQAIQHDLQPVFEPRIHLLVSCGLFRKAALQRIGPFDESLRFYSDDMDWFMRAREQAVSMAVLDDVTLLWRMHERNTSRDRSVRDGALFEVLKRSLARRRQDGPPGPLPDFSRYPKAR
jgi:glycosyltransferase involved in cell wall biosynthesis